MPIASTTSLENVRRELARGTAELAVLSALRVRRRYGYELLKRLEGGDDDLLSVKEGTLYPLLHRLEDAGFIQAEWVAEGRGRPRKYYTLTDSGEKHLQVLRQEWSILVGVLQTLLTSHDEANT